MGNYSPVRKSDDFSGANEGKIERVKEEHQIFSLVILVHKKERELRINFDGSPGWALKGGRPLKLMHLNKMPTIIKKM